MIFQTEIKSMPIPGASLKTIGVAFLSGYLGVDVTERQAKTLAQGLSHRRWVDAIDLMNALGGGVSKVDESTIKPVSIEERNWKRGMIVISLDETSKEIMSDNKGDARYSAALCWIEGAAMGISLADWTIKEHVASAIKYVQRKYPKKE